MAKAVKDNEEKVVEAKASTTSYTVISQFNDKQNFSIVYQVGTDVSHFDEARIKDLLAKGLIEKK